MISALELEVYGKRGCPHTERLLTELQGLPVKKRKMFRAGSDWAARKRYFQSIGRGRINKKTVPVLVVRWREQGRPEWFYHALPSTDAAVRAVRKLKKKKKKKRRLDSI